MTRRLLALCVLLIALPAYALVIDTPLPNTEDEARARSLFYELRCQVCQGQSVADSDAVVARRLRDFVRERVSQGDSSDAIRDAIVEQYGESVLFKSRSSEGIWPLWLLPLSLVAIGITLILRRRRA